MYMYKKVTCTCIGNNLFSRKLCNWAGNFYSYSMFSFLCHLTRKYTKPYYM